MASLVSRDASDPAVGSYSDNIPESRSQEPLVCTISTESMQSAGGSSAVTETISNPDEPNTDDDGGTCGWGLLRPKCIQRFRTPRWVLFWLCWAGALQGLIVNGFINVVITTIERRYELKSTETGLIAGCYDIASFLCLVPVSYLGGSRSKPLFIGIGVLILALGSFVFSLPHFIAGQYSFSHEQEFLCGSEPKVDCNSDVGSTLSNYKYIFFLGQLLHGAGASPFYTLGCTYLDENVPTKMSSVYIGIYYTMALLGPALGYLLGGQLLKIYTDIDIDPNELGLTPSSSVWVGAWWIGFLFSAALGILVAIPICSFPKVLPGFSKIQAAKVTEMHHKLQNSAAAEQGFGISLKDLPISFKFLIYNPTFLFLSFAGASEGMLLAGLATFLPKLIESQFMMPASKAAFMVGLVTIPGAGGGTFLGGYLVKKFNLKCADIIKFCIITSVICLGFAFIFIMHCPNADFAGVNVPVSNSSNSTISLQDDCNKQCKCSSLHYDPVCGSNNVLYYSPCFAGCQKKIVTENSKVYSDCSCIQYNGKTINIDGEEVAIHATREKCTNNCSYIILFLSIVFLSMFLTFLVSMPSLSATLRCVAETQKSFALGIQWIMVRLLGTIPAPIIFGSLIDLSCVLWQDTCHKKGACLFYNNKNMSSNVVIMATLLKALSCIFFFLSWIFYKPPASEDGKTNGIVSQMNNFGSLNRSSRNMIIGMPLTGTVSEEDAQNNEKKNEKCCVWSTQELSNSNASYNNQSTNEKTAR